MATYGSPDNTIEFDVTTGGALQDVSAQVTSINGVSAERVLADVTGYGLAFPAHADTGFTKYADMVWRGPYDDTSTTGSAAVFDHVGDTRSYAITYGGSKKTSGECIIAMFKKIPPAPGSTALVDFEVTLRPTGTQTEA